MKVRLGDIIDGDTVVVKGFTQRVKRARKQTILGIPWTTLDLEPPESEWRSFEWVRSLSGDPDERVERA